VLLREHPGTVTALLEAPMRVDRPVDSLSSHNVDTDSIANRHDSLQRGAEDVIFHPE
jgi:hypothetical protein